jgi:hypothetical protein
VCSLEQQVVGALTWYTNERGHAGTWEMTKEKAVHRSQDRVLGLCLKRLTDVIVFDGGVVERHGYEK